VAHLALPPAETQIPQHGPSFHPPGNPLTGTTTADKLVPILPAADSQCHPTRLKWCGLGASEWHVARRFKDSVFASVDQCHPPLAVSRADDDAGTQRR